MPKVPANRVASVAVMLAAMSPLLPLHIKAATGDKSAATIRQLISKHCFDCHDKSLSKGKLNLQTFPFDLVQSDNRARWVHIFDRIEKGEMPPDADDLPAAERKALVTILEAKLFDADKADVLANGRGPLRRLTREEYEQNLRDVLKLPDLDIRDLLPEDREGHRFNKTSAMLDMSRVQLTAYLDAAEVALRQAVASGVKPPPISRYKGLATRMFQEAQTFGNREAMFYAKAGKAIPMDGKKLREIRKTGEHDPEVEMAIFRSAHWPYYGYPDGFLAKLPGRYRVRFSARAVVQLPGFELKSAKRPVPMTFRARKRSGPDVSGDVRATGGIIDIQPEIGVHETTIILRENETFEYSLLGLPMPLARNVKGGPPTYRYPPLPKGGQPGVAFQWIEVEGPIASSDWPPPSHGVLFDDLPIRASKSGNLLPVEVVSQNRKADAQRLLRRFVNLVARQPVPSSALQKYEELILARLEQGTAFAGAMLTGYKAFLCSGHFLFLAEPKDADDHFTIANRLSHFLANTRPDSQLTRLAVEKKLRDVEVLKTEVNRLIADDGFNRFVKNFADYWLNLRQVRRDEPDVRLHPEYRFDHYLVDSMEGESRAFFAALIRDNLPASALVTTDFIFANDRLAEHYQLPPLSGSAIRKVLLPKGSPYGGLLTQAAILKVTANGTTTSPVLRGAWIMERLIGDPPPPPPASVPAVEPDIRGAKTIRELLALHTKSKSCSACHARFDPVGFALENFDILGGWRTRYRGMEEGEVVTGIDRAGHDFVYTLGEPVDSAGRLRDGRGFQNIHELKTLFAANPRKLARNLLHQFTVYATGTPVRFSDRREIDSLLDACGEEYRVRDLLIALVQSRIFQGQID